MKRKEFCECCRDGITYGKYRPHFGWCLCNECDREARLEEMREEYDEEQRLYQRLLDD